MLDRSPTFDAPAVADIYFSKDAEGADRIPEDQVADSNFYVWVLFDSANPYGRETLVLSSASSSSAEADILLIRISESLFRSERRVAPFSLLSEGSN